MIHPFGYAVLGQRVWYGHLDFYSVFYAPRFHDLITALFICKGNSKKIKVVYHCLAVVCPYLVATPVIFFQYASSNSEEFSVPIVACLLVHITGHGSKKKTTKKDTKMKEFSHTFSTTKSNYLEFLTTVLTKHHIGNKLQVTDYWCYTCKIQVPPST